MTTPELSRPISLSKIRPTGLDVEVRATQEECSAVAARMGLPAIRSLVCHFRLSPEDDGVSVLARGRLHAFVTRVCVVSAEDFETLVEDEFEIRFVPAGTERQDVDPNQPDEIPYEPDTIDLGEATSEQLGLALDPYPRMDGAVIPDFEDNENAGHFSVLSKRFGSGQTRH